MCTHCRAPRSVRSTGRPVVDRPFGIRRPPIRHPHQPKPRRRGRPLHTHRQPSRCSRTGQHLGERLRNRRSNSPIAQRPRRRKIRSQPPAIAMGADPDRRGAATRESALRRCRAAMQRMWREQPGFCCVRARRLKMHVTSAHPTAYDSATIRVIHKHWSTKWQF